MSPFASYSTYLTATKSICTDLVKDVWYKMICQNVGLNVSYLFSLNRTKPAYLITWGCKRNDLSSSVNCSLRVFHFVIVLSSYVVKSNDSYFERTSLICYICYICLICCIHCLGKSLYLAGVVFVREFVRVGSCQALPK